MMTREEAIKQLKDDRVLCINSETEPFAIAYDMAIKALEQEPCEDAIDRKLVCAFIAGLISDDGEREKGLEYIRNMPSVNPQPKTGHWIKMLLTDMSDIAGQCSECGFIHKFIGGHTAQYNYCPNCGAKMIEPQESEE